MPEIVEPQNETIENNTQIQTPQATQTQDNQSTQSTQSQLIQPSQVTSKKGCKCKKTGVQRYYYLLFIFYVLCYIYYYLQAVIV